MSSRRKLGSAVALCLLGSAIVLWAASRVWVTLPTEQGLAFDVTPYTLTGTVLVPGLRALAVLGLAGVVAVIATRSWGRVVVGTLLALSGAVIMLETARWLRPARLRAGAVSYFGHHFRDCAGSCSVDVTRLTEVSTSRFPVVAALLGGAVLCATGVLFAVRGSSWSGMGSSYEAPGGDPEPPVTEKAVWDALDRGDDPTA